MHAEDFLRPAGERFTYGREDAESFRSSWLDTAALEREVLSRNDYYLPALHVALSPAALARRGVPAWQLPAFAVYDREVQPGEVCDVLARAGDPVRPAVLVRGG